MKEKLIINNNKININEMARSGEKRSKTTKIIVTSFYKENIFEYLNSLSLQDKKYLSYNYVLLENGYIYNIVPEEEISYSTYNIEENLESISVGIQCNKNKKLNDIQIIKLRSLLNYICSRNKLSLNKDVFLEYDIYATRNFSYYIDNYFLWEDILK